MTNDVRSMKWYDVYDDDMGMSDDVGHFIDHLVLAIDPLTLPSFLFFTVSPCISTFHLCQLMVDSDIFLVSSGAKNNSSVSNFSRGNSWLSLCFLSKSIASIMGKIGMELLVYWVGWAFVV
jgi:hypothetical protein